MRKFSAPIPMFFNVNGWADGFVAGVFESSFSTNQCILEFKSFMVLLIPLSRKYSTFFSQPSGPEDFLRSAKQKGGGIIETMLTSALSALTINASTNVRE